MTARFDDLVTGRALVCGPAVEVVEAWTADDVVPALRRLDELVEAGRWAWGFVAYEAARAFGLETREALEGLPLLRFEVGDEPAPAPVVVRGPAAERTWTPDWTPAEHAALVAAVRDEIAAGETYQANLTTRLRTRVDDAGELYADLAHASGGGWCALLAWDGRAVCCASPELLVSVDGDDVLMRPMKGTAARGLDALDDAAVAARLRASAKERAENLMIVDLVRNDLARVADDVRAVVVGRAEAYPSVWQLTSDVTGRLRTRSLVDLFGAAFPCGSVTGAPKASTMRLLAGWESSPRGVYCGAVGFVGPGVARFAVPIRTALVSADGEAVYGAGGGITWSSDAAAEWAEVLAKAPKVEPPRRLLETMRWTPGRGIEHADRHVHRMVTSAAYLGIPCSAADLLDLLGTVTGSDDLRVRLLLDPDGVATVETAPLPPVVGVVGLAVDGVPVDPADRWLRHKHDRRAVYDAAAARHPEADDVVLVNDRGLVTETTRANLLVLLDGAWVTPPVSDGLLPGIGRALLLEAGEVVERSVTVAECRSAQAVRTVSSLRGVREAVLTEPVRTPSA